MNAATHPLLPVHADAPALKRAMRSLAGGVSVITAGTGDRRSGATVTSAHSFSMEPPTMVVSLNLSSSTWPVVRDFGHFAVNILARDQQAIADRFAGGGGLKGAERYEGAGWTTLETGAPLLVGALAAIDCTVDEVIERHSHALVFGRVRAVLGNGGDCLLYARGGYGGFAAA
ncbi:flavin reductase family protein [Oryzibacter oryziterrae]|uniref:flavin reductase family protein n=1 Tax=Oryzibacter oryziterrae TaxID=2766474 RepID=UPI001F22EAF0|nr:flavin reductase family protein [Oryzibacter oryziterrae]